MEEKKTLLLNLEEEQELRIDQMLSEDDCLLKVRNLNFRYREDASQKMLIQNFNLEVRVGDHIWIRGRNGAGKSTLLKLLSGYEEESQSFPDYGELLVDEIVVAEHLKIAFSFQEPLWKKGNVKERLASLGKEGEEGYKDFFRLCSSFDIPEDFEKRPLETLSSGELKKIDIARSLSMKNDLLFLDEPLNYMDVNFMEQLRKALCERDVTVVFIEHNEEFGRSVATKWVDFS